MDIEHARENAGPAAITPVVEFDGVSKWYGNVIGLNKLSVRIPPALRGCWVNSLIIFAGTPATK